MKRMSEIQQYVRNIELEEFLESLDVLETDTINRIVEHFSEKEARERDKIVVEYFGEAGVNTIAQSIVKLLYSPPELRSNASILDVGLGSGIFTRKVANQIQLQMPEVTFYGMDITPAMLSLLISQTKEITPILGVAEDITGSIEYAKKYLDVPQRFDAIFSTLMLHHCLDVEKVFQSIKEALNSDGKAIIIDLCKHSFHEFKEEMRDVHLGFNPTLIQEYAERYFSQVSVKKLPGISCSSSGRSAELFISYLTC